jgi:hypothetical protein
MRSKRAKLSVRRHSAVASLMPALAFLCLVISSQPRALGEVRTSAATSFAQADVREPHRRVPHIVVHPAAQTHPGPNSVRQCVSWLEPEYRPSGTVIVPRMRCWWEG